MAQEATRDKWRELIRRQADSDDTVQEFCRKQGVATSSFYAWKKKLRENAGKNAVSVFTPVTVLGHSPAVIEVRFRSRAAVHDSSMLRELPGTVAMAEE